MQVARKVSARASSPDARASSPDTRGSNPAKSETFEFTSRFTGRPVVSGKPRYHDFLNRVEELRLGDIVALDDCRDTKSVIVDVDENELIRFVSAHDGDTGVIIPLRVNEKFPNAMEAFSDVL